MRKWITILLALVLMTTLAVPSMAANYSFSGGSSSFGVSTSTDEPVTADPMSANVRRDKEVASLPTGFGIPGASFSTDITVSWLTTASQTAPSYYADGSIGTLYVARTEQSIRVYEGESLTNLAKGAGHFASSSAWDGNVALAGHNRGSNAYFAFVKDLQPGDVLTYSTPYGTRTYRVTGKTQINEYDNSPLYYSSDNRLTLITCVANVPELRYCVVAVEVG